MARKDDEIDILLKRWASEKRQMLGLTLMEKATAGEFIGAIRCTLSAVKDHHDGAASGTGASQHYPEVFRGLSFYVNQAYHRMRPEHQEATVARYVAHAPEKLKMEVLGLCSTEYWGRVKTAKAIVESWVRCTDIKAA